MIRNVNPRDKKALIVGGVCIAIYILIVGVINPIHARHEDLQQQIQNKVFFIKKYYEILNQKAYYEQKSKAAQAIQDTLKHRFLEDKKPAVAAASLQKILEAYAQQSKVSVESSRIEKPRFVAQILAVPVEINIRSNLRNLTQFIYLIENHEKFMVVEDLVSRRANKGDQEELQTKLLILGFIQELEKASPKTL